MSALPPKADIERGEYVQTACLTDVCFTPKRGHLRYTDECGATAQHEPNHHDTSIRIEYRRSVFANSNERARHRRGTAVFLQRAGMANPAVPPKPIDLNVSLGDEKKMSIKTGDKTLNPRITANNKIQLKFATKEFVGEYFHYTGDLFLIYNSGQLARLSCSCS